MRRWRIYLVFAIPTIARLTSKSLLRNITVTMVVLQKRLGTFTS